LSIIVACGLLVLFYAGIAVRSDSDPFAHTDFMDLMQEHLVPSHERSIALRSYLLRISDIAQATQYDGVNRFARVCRSRRLIGKPDFEFGT
jgi:hypothetical protein